MKLFSLDKTDFKTLLLDRPDKFVQRLFYRTRNSAIQYCLESIRSKFLENGHFVSVSWEESSNIQPFINIKLLHPKTKETYYSSRIVFKRDPHHLYNSMNANVYHLKSIYVTQYFPQKEPEFLKRYISFFNALIQNNVFSENYFSVLNYPFSLSLSSPTSPEESYSFLTEHNFNYNEPKFVLELLMSNASKFSNNYVSLFIKNEFLAKGLRIEKFNLTDNNIDIQVINPTQRGWKYLSLEIEIKETFVKTFLNEKTPFFEINTSHWYISGNENTKVYQDFFDYISCLNTNILPEVIIIKNYPYCLHSHCL